MSQVSKLPIRKDVADRIFEIFIKTFGTYHAVKGISFVVPKRKAIGLLGPNGAGKSTTMHMLIGITTPPSGKILYFGKDFSQNRERSLQKTNYTSSYNELLGRVTVWENLMVFAKLYAINDPKKLANLLEMKDKLVSYLTY